MAERYRAQSHAVFDIGVAIYIPYPCSRPMGEHRCHAQRVLVGSACVGMRASRHRVVEPGLPCVRLIESPVCHVWTF
ncbi:Uncharacterised protein [Mycobacteroides abscessus subsp. massiliense]|nr:Uncharacterised protein [Mycobacteroides abscessus subsp. massiliense]